MLFWVTFIVIPGHILPMMVYWLDIPEIKMVPHWTGKIGGMFYKSIGRKMLILFTEELRLSESSHSTLEPGHLTAR